jgi:hypothetical protein
MTTYHITAWCNFPHYATFEIDATNAKEALLKATERAADEAPWPCDGTAFEWDEFQIVPDGKGKPIIWLEPSRRVADAAQDLLAAAEFTLPLLEALACTRENRQERKAYHQLRRAIKKATKR